MRSPLAYVRTTVSQLLDLAARLVEAVEAILGRFSALIDAINHFEVPESALKEPGDGLLIEAMAARIADLSVAVDEGVKNVQRSERRVRAVVQSARKELAEHGYEHAGLEAEATELRDINADGGENGAVPVVPESVEVDPSLPSPAPGVSMKDFLAIRGRR